MSRHPVLDARELRWRKKRELAGETARQFPEARAAFAFCTLRMPAALRISGKYHGLVALFQNALRKTLGSSGIAILAFGTEQYVDGPGSWLAAECDAMTLKRLAVELEEEHPQGALIDIDVADSVGNPLSRRDMGYPARKCLVCGEDAVLCSAGENHSLSEIADRVERMLAK